MKKTNYLLFSLIAMSGMFGNIGFPTLPPTSKSKPKPKLTPKDESKELERRKTQVLNDLAQHNIQKKQEFPNWKEYDVCNLPVVASNLKNAIKYFNYVTKSNGITFKKVEI